MVAAGCSGAPQPEQPTAEETRALIAEGRTLAERECASCHALEAGQTSPRADAPPMSELLARYDADALATDLIEGVRLGHQDMPQFDFNVIAADALVAYLGSIRR